MKIKPSLSGDMVITDDVWNPRERNNEMSTRTTWLFTGRGNTSRVVEAVGPARKTGRISGIVKAVFKVGAFVTAVGVASLSMPDDGPMLGKSIEFCAIGSHAFPSQPGDGDIQVEARDGTGGNWYDRTMLKIQSALLFYRDAGGPTTGGNVSATAGLEPKTRVPAPGLARRTSVGIKQGGVSSERNGPL